MTGPAVLLFAVFLVLQLSGTVQWSWYLVTAPLWVPLAVECTARLVELVRQRRQ